MEQFLLSPAVLRTYFKDLSNLLIELKSDDMELTDRFIVEPIEVWVPSDHDFFLVKNQIESMKDHSKNTINVAIRRSLLNQDLLYQLSYHEIEEKIKNEFNTLLFQMNYQQERYGDFYFISKLVPSINKIKESINRFPHIIDDLLENKLLPKIADQYIPDQGETISYSIKISDPEFSLSKDPQHQDSFLYLVIDLLDRTMNVVDRFNVSLDFKYLDYPRFMWIYEDENNIDFSHVSYMDEINQSISRFVKRRQKLRYDNVSLLLIDYNGLSSRDSFVADQFDPNDMTIDLFLEMADKGTFSDFVVSYEFLNKDKTVIKAIIHSEVQDDFALFIGPGGVSSSYGPIYSSEHKLKNCSSIRSASNRIQELIGYQTDQVPTMMAIFDKRRQKQLLIGGE